MLTLLETTEKTISEPGIYVGFDIEAYHEDPCPEPSLSGSIAKKMIEQSPAHAMYAHPRLGGKISQDDDEEKYNKARTIGDVAHKLILGRGKVIDVVQADDWRTKAAKEVRDESLARKRVPILAKHFDQADVIARFFRMNMAGHEAGSLPEGQAEVMLAWQEEGFWFRALVDHVTDDLCLITDLKTTSCIVPPYETGRKMAEDGWDVQAAMIERGLNALDPDNAGRRTFRFVLVEQVPPFGVVVCNINEAVLTTGRRKVALAVAKWKECLTTNKWPGYPACIHYPDLPPWDLARWEAKEQNLLWSKQ